MSKIISGVSNWQAPTLKKTTSIASKVGADVYRKDRHIAPVNVIENGTFDTDSAWIKQTGWTIGGGVASFDGTDGDFGIIQAALEAGKAYFLKYEVVQIDQGKLQPQNGASEIGAGATSPGKYRTTFVADGGTALVFLASTSAGARFQGSIDNIVCIAI